MVRRPTGSLNIHLLLLKTWNGELVASRACWRHLFTCLWINVGYSFIRLSVDLPLCCSSPSREVVEEEGDCERGDERGGGGRAVLEPARETRFGKPGRGWRKPTYRIEVPQAFRGAAGCFDNAEVPHSSEYTCSPYPSLL